MESVKGALASVVKSQVGESASAFRKPLEMIQGVLDVAKAVATKTVGGVPLGVAGEFKELLDLQIRTQQEMQTVTMVSNVEKSKHESKMSALRNVRVG